MFIVKIVYSHFHWFHIYLQWFLEIYLCLMSSFCKIKSVSLVLTATTLNIRSRLLLLPPSYIILHISRTRSFNLCLSVFNSRTLNVLNMYHKNSFKKLQCHITSIKYLATVINISKFLSYILLCTSSETSLLIYVCTIFNSGQ